MTWARLAATATALFCWSLTANAEGHPVLVVATDDPELSLALERAAAEQFDGPVALAPSSWRGPVRQGTLLLYVSQEGSHWHIVLKGPDASAARDLTVQSATRLDAVEAIALAIPNLESQVLAKTKTIEQAREARRAEINEEPAKLQRPPSAPAMEAGGHLAPLGSSLPETTPVARIAMVAPEPPQRLEPPRPLVTISLSAGTLLAWHLAAGGLDAGAELSFSGPWLARVTVGGYLANFHQLSLWLVPVDATFGVRWSGERLSADLTAGGELSFAATHIDEGVNTAVVLQSAVALRLSKVWWLGVRAGLAFSTSTSDIDDSVGRELYMPQLQGRVGLLIGYELN